MRISDWSSDVCSSDLGRRQGAWGWIPRLAPWRRGVRGHERPARKADTAGPRPGGQGKRGASGGGFDPHGRCPSANKGRDATRWRDARARPACGGIHAGKVRVSAVRGDAWRPATSKPAPARSEEHTSELQSLMRISYAVSCLKQNKSKEQ